VNFYSSDEFLRPLADTFYLGHRHNTEFVRAGDVALRLLVIDNRHVISKFTFLDYHVPISSCNVNDCARSIGYVEHVALGNLPKGDWLSNPKEEFTPAPYIDWTAFSNFEAYIAYITSHKKGLIREYARRRRRLSEKFGELSFCAHDKSDDVLRLAREWKTNQLIRTGAPNFYADERHSKFLLALLQRGALACSTLRAGGRLLAVWVGFVHEKKWSGWIFTHDPDEELKRYSLGHQLLYSMVEHSCASGHLEFDFSIGGEEYKWIYATHVRLLGSVGRQNLALRLKSRVRSKLRKAVNKSPPLRNLVDFLRQQRR
jgi:hypothetical protein